MTVADERAKGWRAYRGDVPGEDIEPILLFYCPNCADRAFGRPLTVEREVKQLVRTLRTAAETAIEAPSSTRAQTVGRYLRKRFAR